MKPEAIIHEMQKERRSQDVATYGWLPHPEDVRALAEACAQRDLRRSAAGLDDDDEGDKSPDWDALRQACGDAVDREPHIRETFGRAYREAVDDGL